VGWEGRDGREGEETEARGKPPLPSTPHLLLPVPWLVQPVEPQESGAEVFNLGHTLEMDPIGLDLAGVFLKSTPRYFNCAAGWRTKSLRTR
jgi:hypothetical protein